MSPSDRSPRYHAFDGLRAAAILLVVLAHAVLPYVSLPRSFNDPQTHVVFEAIGLYLYSFVMQVFFVMAGFYAALLRERRGVRGLIEHRVRRILVPLIPAYLVLVPLTRGAYAFAAEAATTGSLQAGVDVLLLGHWIRWTKAYHLWFLVALLAFTVIGLGLRWSVLTLGRPVADTIRAASRTLFASRWRSLLLTIVIASTMVPAYLVDTGAVSDPWLRVTLLEFFVLGWLLYVNRDLLPTFRRHAWRRVAVATAVLPLAVWATREAFVPPGNPEPVVALVAGITNCVMTGFMTFGVMGVFLAHGDRPSAVARYVSDASYWIYLIHLPLLVGVSGLLSVTPFPAAIKYALTVGSVLPIVFVTYHVGLRAMEAGAIVRPGRSRRTKGMVLDAPTDSPVG